MFGLSVFQCLTHWFRWDQRIAVFISEERNGSFQGWFQRWSFTWVARASPPTLFLCCIKKANGSQKLPNIEQICYNARIKYLLLRTCNVKSPLNYRSVAFECQPALEPYGKRYMEICPTQDQGRGVPLQRHWGSSLYVQHSPGRGDQGLVGNSHSSTGAPRKRQPSSSALLCAGGATKDLSLPWLLLQLVWKVPSFFPLMSWFCSRTGTGRRWFLFWLC